MYIMYHMYNRLHHFEADRTSNISPGWFLCKQTMLPRPSWCRPCCLAPITSVTILMQENPLWNTTQSPALLPVPAAWCLLPASADGVLLPAACCLLPAACCLLLLPAACCLLLPMVSCTLPPDAAPA